MRNWIPLFLLLLALSSCKTRNAVQNNTESGDSIKTTGNTKHPKDVNEPVKDKIAFYEHVLIPPKFDQIKIDSKVRVETGNYIPPLDATIYIENDKKYG